MLIELTLLSSGSAAYLLKRKVGKPPLVSRLITPPKLSNSQLSRGKSLLHNLRTALLGDERQQQQLSLAPDILAGMEKHKQDANHNLALSIGATGLAVMGNFYPVFGIIGAGAVLYLAREVFRFIWQDFKKGHFFSVYLFGALMLVAMITTGHLLLAALSGVLGGTLLKIVKKAEDSAQTQLTQAFTWHPEQVWVEKDGVEFEMAFALLNKGDTVVVNAGEVIPVDGVILAGLATIDQQVLTGESQPVERMAGDSVFASTLLLSGRLAVRVDTAAEETLAASIANVLDNTQNYKDNQMARGRKIADRFLPVEVGIVAITWAAAGLAPALAIAWSNLGSNMAVLGPLSVLNYLHILSRQGILVKDGRVFESLHQVDTVVFDKTGTLTLEQPEVGQVYALVGYDEQTILRYAAAAEYRQPHPVAKAILAKATQLGLVLPVVDEASYEVGYGIKVTAENHLIHVGSLRFMQHQQIPMPEEAVVSLRQQAEEHGYSLVYVAIDRQVAGILELRPSIRPEAAGIVQSLKQRGLKLYIISGDQERPTRHLAGQLGIDHYFAEVLPENKANLVKQLTNEGRFVCFIGDGINDAIALKAAQVSVSLKGASSVATDTAQIVFMDGTLGRLTALLSLSEEFERTMRNNLVGSIAPGVLNIAAVCFLHTGIAVGMAVYYLGSALGLGNALHPLVKHQNTIAPPVKQAAD
jgi:heavy metal translocating P-type ATPase